MAQVNRLTKADIKLLDEHSGERTADEWSRRLEGRASSRLLRKMAKDRGWAFAKRGRNGRLILG